MEWNLNEILENILLQLNFKKEKNIYNYSTPIVIDNCDQLLKISCFLENDKIVLTDNGLLLEIYCITDNDIKFINDLTYDLFKKYALENKNLCIVKYAKIESIVQDISNFIKSLIFVEKKLKETMNY